MPVYSSFATPPMGYSSNGPINTHTSHTLMDAPHATGEGNGEERIYHVLEPGRDKEYQEVDDRKEEQIYHEPPPGSKNEESHHGNEGSVDYHEIEENDGQRIYHVLTRENDPKESDKTYSKLQHKL